MKHTEPTDGIPACEKTDPFRDHGANRHTLPHLWSAEERQKAFDARIAHLTASLKSGGHGLSTDAALLKMWGDIADRTLLLAMGGTAPAGVAVNASSLAPDYATPERRRLAFTARIDELTKTHGLSFDDAIQAMQNRPEDAALLAAMK